MVAGVMLVLVYTPYRLRISRGVLRILDPDNNVAGEVPVSDIDMLVIVGRGVSLSSSVLLILSRLDAVTVIHDASSDAFVYKPFSVTIPSTRYNQYRASYNREMGLYYARTMIESKLRGLWNLSKYYYSKKLIQDPGDECFNKNIEEARRSGGVDELMRIEAEGSKCFWIRITPLFKDLGFPGRKPRNRDVVNRALDYGYAVLYGLILHALVSAGLDPYAGFMHTVRSGRPSLVYDFSEQYKPFIIHTVLSAARRLKNPEITGEGLLDPSSISYISKTIHGWLNRRRRSIGMSVRKNIYIKSHDLANSLRMGTAYNGFVYRVW